ncbi:MAG: fibro-slime domain-containing protein [Fibrobacteria bacterium]|nr:fibro-slime domain-containing protein [Fibrobacteria bacterium]
MFPLLLFAVDYPPTQKLAVDYFDHYSWPLGSTPAYWEFNGRLTGNYPPGNDGLTPGMVKTTLDADGLPVYSGVDFGNYAKNIHTWYRENLTHADPKYRVVKIPDSLTFTHKGNGVYEFYAQPNGYWYPIDNKPTSLVHTLIEPWGHAIDGSIHNFGFTMHLRKDFIYLEADAAKKDFYFHGDDDVWVFIDGRLVMDLGGFGGGTGQINLATVATQLGLKNGETYTFDFFIAERHEDASSCRITTNLPILVQKLPVPEAVPPTSSFSFKQTVTLTSMVNGADIYYRLGTTGAFTKYTNTPISITANALLEAFVTKLGWKNSDTISEVYSKTGNTSALQLSKFTGEPLGGTSYLTENDTKFIVKLTAPYADLTSVSVTLVTAKGQDRETITIQNPSIQNDALVFMDTVDFAVSGIVSVNTVVEAASYDTVLANWKNQLNSSDSVSSSFPVKPAAKEAKVYFADASWNELSNSLVGTETTLYVVVEDAVFDPSRLQDYVVSLTNRKGDGNDSPEDREVYPLVEIVPGKYGATISVAQSPPVTSLNSSFEIRIGDELNAVYVNPINASEKKDIIGYGVATQQAGQVNFTNQDKSVPPELMLGNIWDGDKKYVYIHYTDDYIIGMTSKNALITVVNTDAQGNVTTDVETVNLTFAERNGDIGGWFLMLPLEDNPRVIPGDGILQYYFKGIAKAQVATHMTGTSERPDGDTVQTLLTIARANEEEVLTLKDPFTGEEPDRQSQVVEICVQDQVFSTVAIDTLLLDKISCVNSGDMLKNVRLIQTSASSNQYCGRVNKQESQSGSTIDNILHCQDIDNLIADYKDPIYSTQGYKQVTIFDRTAAKIQFMDVLGKPISSFSEIEGTQIKVRLTNKTPDLYKIDSLIVHVATEGGDKLDILVIETSINSGIFEALVNIGFSETPNPNDGVIEGTLKPADIYNIASISATRGVVSSSIDVSAAYIPVEKAWIVDGNNDGQGDSIYIKFKAPVSEIPSLITSIDWPYEGAQNYSAGFEPNNVNSAISFKPDLMTITILLPGVLDNNLGVFPIGATSLFAGDEQPKLTLPAGRVFQGQDVPIEDGIGAVVLSAKKHVSDNTYYKDTEGNLQKQPDTLVITLSEKIRAIHSVGIPWDSLFSFMAPNMNKSDAYPLISLPGTQPSVLGPDSLVWTFIVDNGPNTIKPMVNDELFMNANAPYVDASPNANKPVEALKTILGSDNPNPINNSSIYVPVIGAGINDPNAMVANLFVNNDGSISPGRDVVMLQDENGDYAYSRMWVKPVGLNWEGTVNPPGSECVAAISENAGQIEYPENCLSTVQVFSTDAYIAEIAIFDHLGKFVHQSVQYFGHCGELENHYRRTSQGLKSWLVWNQKDLQGKFVSTGVYIWKVKFITSAGQHVSVYRQGIVRAGVDPIGFCAQ